MHSLDEFVCDDDLVVPLLNEQGITVELVDWRADCNWDQFEMVIIRSTWDYQDLKDEFLDVLGNIEASKSVLLNSADVVRWNIDKRYLKELQNMDVAIVPTTWFEGFDRDAVKSAVAQLDCDELIMKPNVSANADNTFRFLKSDWSDEARQNQLAQVFQERGWMLQPFVSSVLTQGEYSLFYVDGEFTHAITKTPKSGDFRVQEEHGGIIEFYEPTNDLKMLGAQILKKTAFDLLFARVDFVEHQGQMCVMEIELIEPALYFRFSNSSVKRFATAVENRILQIKDKRK